MTCGITVAPMMPDASSTLSAPSKRGTRPPTRSIGAGGATIQEIRAKSGAKVFVLPAKNEAVVKGTQEAVAAAVELITARLKEAALERAEARAAEREARGDRPGSNAGRHPDIRPLERRAGLQILFSDPQIAVAGLGLDALKQTGIAYCEAAQSFDNQGRSRVLGRNAGLLKLYADAQSGEFLGAEMIAPQAEHLAHLLAWCRQMRLDVDRMLGLPFYHPTIEEGLRSGLRELRRALGRRNTPPAGCLDCGPGA